MISIITASYNYEKYLKETIESVLAQTYSDWELIVVDDCSSDNSCAVVESFQDSRIKLIKNEKNLGLKKALLRGIQKAQGDYIAFLESDDLWRNDYLEKKVEVIKKHPQTALIFNHVELFGDERKIKRVQKIFENNNKYLSKFIYPKNLFKELNVKNRILTFSCVMLKKNAFNEEYFHPPVDKLLDWWFYIHLAENNNFYYIPEKLTKWRIHTGSYITAKKSRPCLINVEAYWDIYKTRKTDIALLLFILKTTILSGFYFIEKNFRKLKFRLFNP